MSEAELKNNYIDKYKQVVDFMEGLQMMELMEDNVIKLNIAKSSTPKHWIYHFLVPYKDSSLIPSFRELPKSKNLNIFSVYCNKHIEQIVVKASILTSSSNSTRNMLFNNITDSLRKRGFRNISYDIRPTSSPDFRYPQNFIKVLTSKDNTLEDIHKIYVFIKKYNNELHEDWMIKNPW